MASARLTLRITPKSSLDAVMGWQGDALKIKVRAAPENGRANAAVVEVLAKALGLPKSALTLESGESSRHKRVCIRGLALVDVKKRLDAALAA